jgi:hypothetical protein
MRAFHARRVKISRISPPWKNRKLVFIGILRKKAVGISGAKEFLVSVLTVIAVPTTFANCHPNRNKIKAH